MCVLSMIRVDHFLIVLCAAAGLLPPYSSSNVTEFYSELVSKLYNVSFVSPRSIDYRLLKSLLGEEKYETCIMARSIQRDVQP